MPPGYQLSASAAEVSLQPVGRQRLKGTETRPAGGSSRSQRLAQAHHHAVRGRAESIGTRGGVHAGSRQLGSGPTCTTAGVQPPPPPCRRWPAEAQGGGSGGAVPPSEGRQGLSAGSSRPPSPAERDVGAQVAAPPFAPK